MTKNAKKNLFQYLENLKKTSSDRKALCYGLMTAIFFLRGTEIIWHAAISEVLEWVKGRAGEASFSTLEASEVTHEF